MKTLRNMKTEEIISYKFLVLSFEVELTKSLQLNTKNYF